MIEAEIIYRLASIRRTYQVGDEAVHALNGVDLTIGEREFIAVVGSSGSGKSTLMHMLGFMDTPTDGRMWFEGEEVSEISRAHRAHLRATRIGFIFQAFNLLPKITVLQNVVLPLSYGRQRIADANGLGMQVLRRVGMEHRHMHRPAQLSGGERQRVAIARALINSPRLILADEPTGNLDSKNRDRIMELFTSLLDEGITLAVVTHDTEVAAYAQRHINMQDGCIVEDSRK